LAHKGPLVLTVRRVLPELTARRVLPELTARRVLPELTVTTARLVLPELTVPPVPRARRVRPVLMATLVQPTFNYQQACGPNQQVVQLQKAARQILISLLVLLAIPSNWILAAKR
jgi:hypothetical protein